MDSDTNQKFLIFFLTEVSYVGMVFLLLRGDMMYSFARKNLAIKPVTTRTTLDQIFYEWAPP